MALTTDQLETRPDQRVASPTHPSASDAPTHVPTAETPPRGPHHVVGWVLVAAAIALVGVLAVRLVTDDSPPAFNGDVKDHPRYGQVTPVAEPAFSGDVKDHPRYGAATQAAPEWNGDVKDHPRYQTTP
jgi:hypothetical protein